ncbi:hypothetical protein BJX96DRAFT_119269 [Aspergillus floccosus]
MSLKTPPTLLTILLLVLDLRTDGYGILQSSRSHCKAKSLDPGIFDIMTHEIYIARDAPQFSWTTASTNNMRWKTHPNHQCPDVLRTHHHDQPEDASCGGMRYIQKASHRVFRHQGAQECDPLHKILESVTPPYRSPTHV